MNKALGFTLGVVTITAALAASPAALAQDAYLVGITAAMTGPAAGNQAPVVDALKVYLDHINDQGGVNGKPIKLIVYDDSAQPSRAAANAKRMVRDKVVLMMNSSLSSTYAPVVAESRRAKIPLYYAGAVCPKDTFPPADPLQFCSTAYGANLDSQGALAFVKNTAKEPVRIGFAAMAIPVARAEIDYAEGLAKQLGMTPVDKELSPPPAPDYTPYATKLKDANPNWVYSWSPWVSEIRTFEALRRLGWSGSYITWAQPSAEEELARIKDPKFYVIGTNAFLQDEPAMAAEMRAVVHRADLKYPVTYMTDGFVAGLVVAQVMKNTPWPPTPAKVLNAMNHLNVDLKGLRGGPLVWTPENHFRPKQYYRVWHWDGAKISRAQDWHAIPVKH